MATPETLQAENEQLRLLVEEYRQRELGDLRQALAEARAEAAHYRAEADRNANLGRQIHTESQATIADLRSKLEATQRVPNARVNPRP